MSWLFGKKKKKEISVSQKTEDSTNKSIEKMDQTISLLEKRKKLLEKKMEQETEKAKDFMKKGDKSSAMTCLKRKKQYEVQVQRLDQQIMNNEQMKLTLENAATDIETLKAQQQAAKTMKQVFKETGGIDKVQDVMDEIQDTMATANELGDALAQDLGTGQIIDEGELEDELDMMEQEELDKQMLGMKQTKVPTGPLTKGTATTATASKPVKTAKEVDDELAELEAELNA
ncbi:hypothetical protein FDP41_008907 [Naegleria fowleri]|uniref:Uncharacterized protein n=1 Tax=Naegleria fowleri TaxID=5763 RepID=A0A6A5BFB9_NAEFO|nr:uncharacterized protein FDP41_008907 [Naegleria fowleri]KAF0972658.1 hypothetical protein FDP41_008907 [Naegleria fowleri]CAG4711852.1 unnamed protein product [Naegleria fowleri]